MFYLIDNKNKIIFGWSAKCGCSHIKHLFNFLSNNKENVNNIHKNINVYRVLPNNIENYITIIISRNPYKRIVSGFLDKYKLGGEFRHLWKYNYITFSMFVNELVKKNWKMIENHHFTPQTSEGFDIKILKSKCIKCFDIENIDYKYIENLYNRTIPEHILQKKEGHERVQNIKDDTILGQPLYDLYMITYLNKKVELRYFYNEDLKRKVFNFYKNDFTFFNEMGLDYITTTF